MSQYSVVFKNNSSNFGTVCLYQTCPELDADVMSLAWFSKSAHPTTKLTFKWDIKYSFIWDETGVLVPGVVFDASQTWDADLSNNNAITFTKQNGAYTFKDLVRGEKDGMLQITEDYTVPVKQAAVGIGMSGAGTFVKQAQPNMTLFFKPHPEYWITFGNYVQGQVLDVTEITNKAKIEFGPGIYQMVAVLKDDNSWEITDNTGAL
ncbi:protein rhiA [Heliobacterium undosum]|uniref:Protein rhiA n=1 Tax=Heliomicrobium undosum TaxID=121734 RepID=A0A845L7S4_9FIRM|nr:protein rhiA [Heliomicrobium undosum]MZP29778.1 protein rhiA [Heliomicrobium undosum]